VLTDRTDNFIQGRPDLEDKIRRLTAFGRRAAESRRQADQPASGLPFSEVSALLAS
jgi:hypothetical protein